MSTSPVKAPTDPPVRPMTDSDQWYESGPEPIWNDPQTATLMIRIGMAQNALVAEMEMANLVTNAIHSDARRQRGSLSRLVMTAALVSEAAKLAQKSMRELRRLASSARREARIGLFEEIGQLCARQAPRQQSDRAGSQQGWLPLGRGRSWSFSH